MGANTSIMWFRQDLRIADNPALCAAAASGPVVPVYIWAPQEEGDWPPGAAGSWYLHHSLQSLGETLRQLGSRLILRRGDSLESLRDLIRRTGARSVYWNRRYELAARSRDERVAEVLAAEGVELWRFTGSLLFEPGTIMSKAGAPFRVFTAFWNSCRSAPPVATLPAPRRLSSVRKWPPSLHLDDLELKPTHPWTAGLRVVWEAGEPIARRRLTAFIRRGLAQYHRDRGRLDADSTSRLSPHLHFGEISPWQVWHAAVRRAAQFQEGVDSFLAEIGWREFAHHLLVHFPSSALQPLRPEFERFPWSRDEAALRRWQQGRTGFPVVDAAMRALWSTGWMTNRARMIVASFLTKDLLIPWQEGARWFWDTLVDADLANNTLGWQWTAGCGADAAPYFRVFNPTKQARQFDPDGTFIRRWVPEIAELPSRWIFEPWHAPAEALHKAGIRLGENYPHPIVDHSAARFAALAAFRALR